MTTLNMQRKSSANIFGTARRDVDNSGCVAAVIYVECVFYGLQNEKETAFSVPLINHIFLLL